MKTITFQRLLSLVNSALWNEPINESLFTDMDSKLWRELYYFAVRHGVLAVSYDGLLHLSSDHRPSLELHMRWALSVEQIEKRHEQILNATTGLSDLFRKQHINMLVFKGLSLSSYYPIPAHREFGDIDIYLFGKHKEGDTLLKSIAVNKNASNHYKHSNYYYRDIMIENHAYLLNVRDSAQIKKLNLVLLDILQQNRTGENIHKDKLLFPSPDFTALFFIIHAIKHLSTAPLQLRTYCDWALFLKEHANELNTDKWKNTLDNAGLLKIAEAITSLAVQWLAPSLDIPFPLRDHPELEKRISNEMLKPFYSPCQSKAPHKVFIYKYKRLCKICQRHISFYGGNLYKHSFSRFYSSFIDHVRHPETIFKIQ